MRLVKYVALLSVMVSVRLVAQDRVPVEQASGGFVVDFDHQDVRVVLSALAQAADVNVVFNRLPEIRTTLRLGQPVPKEQLVDVMREVAEGNGLVMTQTGTLIHIGAPDSREGLGRPSRTTEQPAPDTRLYTYRLKYASAPELAPVLMNLLGGNGLGDRAASTGGRGTSGGITGTGGSGGAAVSTFGGGSSGAGSSRSFGPRGGGSPGPNLSAAPGAMSRVRIVANEPTNTLLISATPGEWEWIQQIVESVDLRPLQVLIEAVIVEVNRSTDLNVGVDATAVHNRHGQRANADLPSLPDARDFLLQFAGGRGTVDFTAALNALATRGDIRVRSLPVIVAQNNKEALLNVGSRRPFVQVSQTVPNDPTGRVQTIQYLDVGTRLQIVPRINADGYVNLEVTQTANSATNEIQFDAPVLSQREATTQVFLKDGQTTVLGGLADRTRDETRTGIPFLRSIPVIGWLFGTTRRSELQSELYLFLTPHIIADDADVDRYRDALQQKSEALRRDPVVPMFPPPAQRDSMPLPAPRDSTP